MRALPSGEELRPFVLAAEAILNEQSPTKQSEAKRRYSPMYRLLSQEDGDFILAGLSASADLDAVREACAAFRAGRRAAFLGYVKHLRADALHADQLALAQGSNWGHIIAHGLRIEYHVACLRFCCLLHRFYLPASEMVARHIDALCSSLQQRSASVVAIR